MNIVTILFLAGILIRCPASAQAQSRTLTKSDAHQTWYGVTVSPGTNKIAVTAGHKLNPVWWFGNADESKAPNWYRPHDSHRDLSWRLRNPFHNFDFYVIGCADKT